MKDNIMEKNPKYLVEVLVDQKTNKKSSFYFSTISEASEKFKKFSDEGYACAMFNFV